MFAVILQFVRWVFRTFAPGVIIVGLGFVAFGLWLFLQDKVEIDHWRHENVRQIAREQAETKRALDDTHKRMDRIAAEITAEKERGKQADKIIATLRDLESTWDKFTGQAEQQKTNAERIASLTTMRVATTAKLASLQQEFTRATWARDGLEIALGKSEAKLAAAKTEQSPVLQYAERTWNYEVGREPLRMAVKWWVVVALGLYFIGPMMGKVAWFAWKNR